MHANHRRGPRRWVVGVTVLLLIGCAAKGDRLRKRRPHKPRSQAQKAKIFAKKQTDEQKTKTSPKLRALNALAIKAGAKRVPVENPCVEGTEDNCFRRALDRMFVRLDTLVDAPRRSVRILHLGDSHVAADYITGTIRDRLQARFGDGGRGFVHIEQKNQYGGRRLARRGAWLRTRIIDRGQGGNEFGFSGMALESRARNAWVEYALDDDERLTLFYLAHPDGALVELTVGGEPIGQVDTTAKDTHSSYKTFAVPKRPERSKADDRVLRITARGRGAKLFGISFTENKRGLIYDSIGPVGADARVYRSFDPKSMSEHLRVLDPDLVVLMVGNNDALRINQRRATAENVREDLEVVIARVQDALPETDCILWSPMDAGVRKGGRIVPRPNHDTVRDLQREVAGKMGCGFWDMYGAMGGTGSLSRWHELNIINKDLIHPRKKAGQLLGHLFSHAFVDAYENVE